MATSQAQQMNAYMQLMKGWRISASGQGISLNEYFVKKACEILNGHGYDLPSFTRAYYRDQTTAGNIYPYLDGYCFDIENKKRNELTLIVCDFSYSTTLQNMKQDELDKHFSHVKAFYTKAKRNVFFGVSQGAPMAPAVNVITNSEKGFIEKGGTITFFLISNKNIPRTLRLPKDEIWNETDCKIKHQVADFNVISSVEKPPLELNFTSIAGGKYKQGVPFLKATTSEQVDCYQSYLFVLPAEALVACYEEHGTRLLEHNVRVYLQRKGKVNRGIQDTIKNEPHAFFIYNNGLAMTADSVQFSETGDRIICIHNPQVVNGGQTMASLHDAVMQEKRNISSISVQVKLTVIPKLLTDVIVPYISLYSNSQNAVKEPDINSNALVQRAYEDYSRTIPIPGGRAVYWYYERLKGQYANAQLHMTPKQKENFADTYPKKFKVLPVEIAQAVMAYEKMPYLVLRGAQKCYSGDGALNGFCDYVAAAKAVDDRLVLSVDWYKSSIAKRILFIQTRETVRQIFKNNDKYAAYKIYASTAYVYIISLLVAILQEKGLSLNLNSIWDYQCIDKCTIGNIHLLFRFVFEEIAKDPAFVENFKKKSTWNRIQQKAIEDEVLVQSLIVNSVFYSDTPPFFITDIPIFSPDTTPEMKKVLTYPDSYWDKLDTWLNHQYKIEKPAALDKRLKNKKLTQSNCVALLKLAEECNKIPGAPALPNIPPLPKSPVDQALGNPVETFFGNGDYDILLLDRTCDFKGGSLFLNDLFQKNPTILTEERNSNECEPELGEIRVFKLDERKKVVFAYTRRTPQSVFYLPVLGICLSSLCSEFNHDIKIIMPHIGYEGAEPQNALNRGRIFKCVTEELYTKKRITLMSLPLEKK